MDIAIIGAGPAGSAAALALRRHAPHLSVALLDAGGLTARKPGEILPAAAAPMLRTLGVWDRFAAARFLPDPVIASAWGGEAFVDSHSLYSARGPGWRLDRRQFDALLARASGARLLTRWRVLRIEGGQGDWRLIAADRRTLSARAIVLATGRSPRLAAQLGAKRLTEDRLVGAVRFCRGGSDPRTLIEAREHGWWYAAHIAPGLRAIACMTEGAEVKALDLTRPTGWRRAAPEAFQAERLGPLRVFPAGGGRLDRVAGPGWAAAGDAAVSFDPLSSQGITQALRGGAFAGYAVADMLAGDTARAVQRLEAHRTATWAAYAAAHAEVYGREGRWPESPFWLGRRARALAAA